MSIRIRIIHGALVAVTVLRLEKAIAQSPTGVAAPELRLQSMTVIVRDYDEALRWYRDKLGFAVIRDQTFGQGARFVQVAASPSAETGIVLERWEGGGGPEMTTTYADRIGKEVNIVLRSANVTQAYETLRARGVEFTQPPRKQPWGGEALFKDLYGNTFVIVGPLSSAQPASRSPQVEPR